MVSLASWPASIDDSHTPLHGHASCQIHRLPLDAISKNPNRKRITYSHLKKKKKHHDPFFRLGS